MKTTYLISDLHLSHAFSLRWSTPRPFATTEEMDEKIIENWNSVIKPGTRCYILGDVVVRPRKALELLGRLNGDKVLIKGNHDIYKIEEYLPYFRDIRAYHVLDKCILSHIPVHKSQIGRFRGNIHGHLHENRVLLPDGSIDPDYLNVCVEKINYTPIELSEAIKRLESQKEGIF